MDDIEGAGGLETVLERVERAAVWVNSSSDEFAYLNAGVETIWGRPLESLTPAALVDGIHRADRDPIRAVIEGRRPLDGDQTFEHRVVHPDGSQRWVRTVLSPAAGRIVGVATDITAQKRREHLFENRYRYLFEEAPVMAVLTTLEEQGPVVRDCNQLFLERLGYDSDDVIGHELAEFYTPYSRRKLLEEGGYDRVIDGESVREERTLVAADGTVVETLLRAVPRIALESDVRGTLALYIDISEREALRRKKDGLEQFTSVVSHDLRNPLSVAQSYTDLAREECDSDHLEAVADAHDRMDALIDDLLTLARSGTQIDEPVAVSLAAVAEAAWTNVDTADATLVTHADQRLWADRSRLTQLLENLVRNSVEHAGDDVVVSVGPIEDGFYVEDDGPGIQPADREDVFDFGYTTSTDGTGFGLSIVERIVEAHGWTVRVTDGDDGGARFDVTDVDLVDS